MAVHSCGEVGAGSCWVHLFEVFHQVPVVVRAVQAAGLRAPEVFGHAGREVLSQDVGVQLSHVIGLELALRALLVLQLQVLPLLVLVPDDLHPVVVVAVAALEPLPLPPGVPGAVHPLHVGVHVGLVRLIRLSNLDRVYGCLFFRLWGLI